MTEAEEKIIDEIGRVSNKGYWAAKRTSRLRKQLKRAEEVHEACLDKLRGLQEVLKMMEAEKI